MRTHFYRFILIPIFVGVFFQVFTKEPSSSSQSAEESGMVQFFDSFKKVKNEFQSKDEK